MCLAVPGRIIEIDERHDPLNRSGKVSFSGIAKVVNLAYVPEAQIDDYVIVHAGFAISLLDQDEANAVLEEVRALAKAQGETLE
jgi:hydrogenase expression/formation protein HypC